MDQFISRAWPEWQGATLRKRSGGWNNTTYFVEKHTKMAVLRIYDTHKDKEKIAFEHAVLQQLGASSLPFKVPAPVTTIHGGTIVQITESGKFACLFEYIPGDSPEESETGYLEAFGEAAGRLSAALAGTDTGLSPVYRPYYELRTSYPRCTEEVIRGLCLNPPEPFKELGSELERLYIAYGDISEALTELKSLPHQLVHGDLNASNLLVTPDERSKIAALLDFEFCTFDVRVMEPAVILSGLLGHTEQDPMIRDFCRGFSRIIALTEAEMRAIPVLMLLRKIDVFLHFVSRYLEGTDEAHVLQEQTRLLAADLHQLSIETAGIQAVLLEEQARIPLTGPSN